MRSTKHPCKLMRLRFGWILLGSSDESILVNLSRAGESVDFRVRPERALLVKLTPQSHHTHSIIRRHTSILQLSHHDPLQTHPAEKFTYRTSPDPICRHPTRKRRINLMWRFTFNVTDSKSGQSKLHRPTTTFANFISRFLYLDVVRLLKLQRLLNGLLCV